MNVHDPFNTVRSDFIEKIGLVVQGDGMSRIAGRIMGLMVFDGRAYSFSELAEELQVSRGSISSNARFLEEHCVIERVGKPGDRQDYFKLADDPFVTIMKAAVQRTRKAATAIQKTIDELPKGNDAVEKRLTDYRSFYQNIGDAIASIDTDNT